MIMRLWKDGTTALKSKQSMVNGFKLDQMPSIKYSNSLKYYNRKRLHSKLGYISQEAFEAKKVALKSGQDQYPQGALLKPPDLMICER